MILKNIGNRKGFTNYIKKKLNNKNLYLNNTFNIGYNLNFIVKPIDTA